MISYSIVTFISLSSGFEATIVSSKLTLGSKFIIELLISSSIARAETSSTCSNRDSEILDPKSGLKNFSPGYVNTIFRIERAIALVSDK